MNAHRPAAAAGIGGKPQPPIDAVPTPLRWASDALRTAVSADVLRRADRNPALAVRLLRAGRLDDPVLTGILLAVVQLRQGRLSAAADEALIAAYTAARESSPDPIRLFLAQAVVADTACCLDSPTAQAACDTYRSLAVLHRGEQHAVYAEALFAVTYYHRQNCWIAADQRLDIRARRRLRHGDGSPVDRMRARGLDAMAEHPAAGTAIREPLPIGIPWSSLRHLPENVLADRVQAHICACRRWNLATGRPAPPEGANVDATDPVEPRDGIR